MPTISRAELGRRVRAARKALGLSQEQLAVQAGTNGLTLRRMEKGEPNIRLETIRGVLRILGLAFEVRIAGARLELAEAA